MNRVLALLFFGGLLFLLFPGNKVLSQNQYSESKSVVVGATVGTNRLTISGYHSPYASIILKTPDGTFLASTTADQNGYFSISDVLINASELTYCFQVVDFKRIGISESCITLDGPIIGDVTYTDVFLPPSIGLSRERINAGGDVSVFGYTMPGATVELYINGEIVTVTADSTGYYSYIYENVPEGIFTFSATATFEGKPSIQPTNNVVLESLSVTQQLTDKGEEIVDQVDKTIDKVLPFNIWPFLLLALALLTAIGILLYKLKFRPWMIIIDKIRRRKKMHHDWFLDRW